MAPIMCPAASWSLRLFALGASFALGVHAQASDGLRSEEPMAEERVLNVKCGNHEGCKPGRNVWFFLRGCKCMECVSDDWQWQEDTWQCKRTCHGKTQTWESTCKDACSEAVNALKKSDTQASYELTPVSCEENAAHTLEVKYVPRTVCPPSLNQDPSTKCVDEKKFSCNPAQKTCHR